MQASQQSHSSDDAGYFIHLIVHAVLRHSLSTNRIMAVVAAQMQSERIYAYILPLGGQLIEPHSVMGEEAQGERDEISAVCEVRPG